MTLQGEHLLVTGATGLIGSGLCQRFVGQGARVCGTGRKLENIAHLQDQGVELRYADYADRASMSELLVGKDMVINAAAWLMQHGDSERGFEINVEATGDLFAAAEKAGVKRFVHFSSMAVYGGSDDPLMDDEREPDTTQNALYGRTKALGEQRLRSLAEGSNCELVILRPGMVYGPGSMTFTVTLLKMVRYGIPVLFGDGEGTAHPVYIDNLIDATVLAAAAPQSAGETFNIVDIEPTWNEFFGYYGRMVGRAPRRAPSWLAENGLKLVKLLGRRDINYETIKMYQAKSIYRTGKIERMLGHSPKISLSEGMAMTERWLRQEGYLPDTNGQGNRRS